MTFRPAEFVAADTPSRQRLFPQYGGWRGATAALMEPSLRDNRCFVTGVQSG